MVEKTRVCGHCNRSLPQSMFGTRRLHCNKCYNLGKRYRATYRQIKELWETQGGACALCATPLELDSTVRNQADAVHVDHCHSTNDIRGLLCRHCNLLLGHAKDRIVVLQAAIRYLRKSDSAAAEGTASYEKDEDGKEDRQSDG